MLTLKAPAKINWFLKVLGRRSDGYHEIQSLLQKITIYDVLTFSLLEEASRGGIQRELTPSDNIVLKTAAPIPLKQNLIYRAGLLLKTRYGIEKGVMISLEKNIPMGAGLGGGSSDAAAALLGLNSLWSLGLSIGELSPLAEELGSDVPFFLGGALSYAQGRGEKIIPCNAREPFNLLLVKPDFEVPTAWVYKNFAILTKKEENVNNIKHFIRNIERAELGGITGGLSNDLESVTINSYPVIAEIKKILRNQGAVFSAMSGSGSTVFGVFESRKKAEDASVVFEKFWTAVVQTVTD